MKQKLLSTSALTLFLVLPGYAQNTGIGTSSPSEKLEVAGMIYTNAGGIKFPDATVQTTAAMSALDPTIPLERGIGYARFLHADLEGEINALGMIKLSLLYDLNFDIEHIPPTGGGGPSKNISKLKIIKQTDRGTSGFFKHLVAQTFSGNLEFYLTRPNSTSGELEAYMKIRLQNAAVSYFRPHHTPSLDGNFENTDEIHFVFLRIYMSHISPATCYCFDVPSQAECPAGYTCP